MRQQPSRDFTIVDLARGFAIAAHTAVNQKRKYTGEDYHVHPEEVLSILLTYHDPAPEEQAAALLHDVVEDTHTTREHIARVFGQQVADYVMEVSDVSKPEDGNRKTRKALDRDHLANASLEGMILKCADLISNCRSIAKYDKAFAVTFLDEAVAIADVFCNGLWSHRIYEKLLRVLNDAFQSVYEDPTKLEWAIEKLQVNHPLTVERMTSK